MCARARVHAHVRARAAKSETRRKIKEIFRESMFLDVIRRAEFGFEGFGTQFQIFSDLPDRGGWGVLGNFLTNKLKISINKTDTTRGGT